MGKTRLLPKKICVRDMKIQKLSMKNDDDKLNELLCVIKSNIEHLFFWIRPISLSGRELNSIDDLKRYYKNSMCYAIFHNGKIIGCIDICKTRRNEEKLSYRKINFWVDKNHARKGIMYKCLNSLEEIFKNHGLDYMMATIEEINIPSVNLVTKMGFDDVSPFTFFVNEEKGSMWYVFEYRKILTGKTNEKNGE
jgi:RimJ/RimL family protein N-acetyltransferase